MSSDTNLVTRERWMNILRVLNERQGALVYGDEITDLMPRDILCINLEYLHEHGLVEARISRSLSGQWSFGGALIKPSGIDYLSEDGGLTSELNVVTVKINAETIKGMIEEYIDASSADKTVKAKLKSALRSLPADGLKSLTSGLVHMGLSNSPGLIHWLETMLPR